MAGYFFKMQLHCFGVGLRQSKCCTFAKGRANGTEDVGVGITLVGGLGWPCSAFCPLPHDAVFLTDAGFVLEPDFYRRFGRHMFQVGLQRIAEVFL